jgi:hypothetical protein
VVPEDERVLLARDAEGRLLVQATVSIEVRYEQDVEVDVPARDFEARHQEDA